ncbi:epoxide hydrolase family protein [Actinokineospora pegani]|uniref:epoxide hydrolase family protein n=1 Tax=Actinokineospora pegani TaxID=2654637 RepID=UPI0018D4C544|nr:epoxide hydrolase family protein [Actinokineospora pegani]
MRPFTVSIDEAVLADLRARLRAARWPTPAPGAPWSQGTDLAFLREVVDHWANRFDWRARQAWLNGFEHSTALVGDVDVHFVHQRAVSGHGRVPLLLTHGWPSTFTELLPLVAPLTDPVAHGIPGPGFDLVIPSLPGYGFTPRPPRRHTMADTADLWHALMTGLGHDRYAAHGGDFGAGVATFLGLRHGPSLIGLHLGNLELDPWLGSELTGPERDLVAAEADFVEREGGYHLVQETKPQTLGYALADSPVGLAAWVLEKWRAWSDCDGDLTSRFALDDLLTTLTLFWATNTITDSMRDFHDNRDLYELTSADRVRVPTAVALFWREFAHQGKVPRTWAERLYDVRRWTEMPRGGHFPAMEEPDLLARDIAAFFAELTRTT